jgi:hypothetical protein
MLRNAIHNGRLLLIAGGATCALAAAGALRADLMVSHSFGRVLGAQSAPQPFEAAPPGGIRQAAHVGDEGYWLTRAEVESPAPFAKRLVVGDRITISGQDGRERVLEVIDTRAIGESLTKVAAGTAPLRLVLVTCRIVDGGEREASAPVRFIIEGELGETPTVQPAPQAKTL